MTTLNILIACYNDSVAEVPEIFLAQRGDVRYIVSHQMSRDYADDHPELASRISRALDRSDVVYSAFVGKGLSQNRNRCLDVLADCLKSEFPSGQSSDGAGIAAAALKDQLCVIADDDVRYGEKSPERIIALFSENPSADIVAFRIATPPGQPPFKEYPEARFRVKKVPVYGRFCFSSIELAFRLSSVLSGGIRFDENFGLGSAVWPEGGEESVFLSDCLSSGMRMEYFPEYLVTHPYESTGKKRKTVRKAQMLEALAVRCRGKLSSAAFVGRLRVIYRRVLSDLRK